MKRLKKKKNPMNKVDVNQIIRMTNYLNISCLITALWETSVLEDKELKSDYVSDVLTAYKIYLSEAADHRQTVAGAIEACEYLTGFDPIAIIDEVFGGELI